MVGTWVSEFSEDQVFFEERKFKILPQVRHREVLKERNGESEEKVCM